MTYLHRPTVYCAGKLPRAETFLSLTHDPAWSHVDFTARWPHLAQLESNDEEITKEIALLEEANNNATSWTVRARSEEIKHLKSKLRRAHPTAAEFGHFWTMDIQDVQRSDFTLLWAGPNNEDLPSLKGGLVEAGAALGAGRCVLLVGYFPDHSWRFHPRCVPLPNLEEARNFLLRYAIRS